MKDIDRHFMQKALDLASIAAGQGEIPVGSVVVDNNGQLIGQGYNCSISLFDPTAHAEIIALRQAAQRIKNYRLLDATVYVTLEPCPMCAGALIQARIKRLVFSCRDFKSGACGGVTNVINGQSSNHAVIIDEGVMAEQSSKLLSQFFTQKR